MSRITAPVSKLTRAITSTPASRPSSTLIDSTAHVHNAGAVLMPKYAELLRTPRSSGSNGEHSDVSPFHHHRRLQTNPSFPIPLDLLNPKKRRLTLPLLQSSRTITTAHRPTPQPSIANRPKPLMQSFHSSSPSSSAMTASHIDATVIPDMAAFAPAVPSSDPVVPLLPDNYSANGGYNVDSVPEPVAAMPKSAIVAADPDKVLPGTPLREVREAGLDGVELKFVHEGSGSGPDDQSTLLSDIWKGMMDDVFGAKKAA
jgi:hypothetical protein